MDKITGKEIFPCPFCGSNNGNVVNSGHLGSDNHLAVECDGCGAIGPEAEYTDSCFSDDEEVEEARVEAIEKWNSRCDFKKKV